MAKKQKIWFAIFLTMFAVPELLWGTAFGLWTTSQSIFDLSNRSLLITVQMLQLFGVVAIIVNLSIVLKVKNLIFWIAQLFFTLLALKIGFVLYVLLATSHAWL